MACSFGQDLVSTSYTFFRYVEVVTERMHDKLDPLYDMQIARLMSESRSVQVALRHLRRHLCSAHQESLESLEELSTYLHGSFEATLNYKRPFSSANVQGLPIEASAVDNDDTMKREMELATVYCGRAAAMGMLLVHYLVLEFTVMLARIEDTKVADNQLMTTEKEFHGIMRNINQYLHERETDVKSIITGLDAAPPNPADTLKVKKLVTKMIEVNVFKHTYFTPVQAMFADNTNTEPLFHRQIYYTMVAESLRQYETTSPPPTIQALYKFTEQRLVVFRGNGLGYGPEPYRPLEDREYRAVLAKRFKCFTQNPEYKYSTLAYTEATTGGDMVIQRGGHGHINVTPRRQVHLFKAQYGWEAGRDWRLLAIATSEVGLMSDLINVLPAIVATNLKFRTSAEYPSAELHSLHTRFMGPMDALKVGARVTSAPLTTITDSVRTYKIARSKIRDPVVPNAINTQPMPDNLRAWMTKIIEEFPDQDLTNMTTNGIVSFHANEKPIVSRNVTWIKDMYSHISIQYQKYEYKNSMFLMHFGSALLNIDQHICCATPKVLDAVTGAMQLNQDEYNLSHFIDATIVPGIGPFTIQYDTLRAIRASIRETQEGFLAAIKARTAPFPHPDSWLTYKDSQDDAWTLVQDGHDIVHGTIIHYGGLLGMPVAPADRISTDTNNALKKFNGEFKAETDAATGAAGGP